MPATSTTDAIIAMSTAPTYGATSPDAMVETISFGRPIGSARIAAVAIVVLPEPPAASTPSHCFVARSASTVARAPSAIAATAEPRSPAARSACEVGAAGAGHLRRRRWSRSRGVLADAGVDDDHVDAAVTETIAKERALGALRVERPDQDDRRHRSTCPAPLSGRARDRARGRDVVERHRAERLEERDAAWEKSSCSRPRLTTTTSPATSIVARPRWSCRPTVDRHHLLASSWRCSCTRLPAS